MNGCERKPSYKEKEKTATNAYFKIFPYISEYLSPALSGCFRKYAKEESSSTGTERSLILAKF